MPGLNLNHINDNGPMSQQDDTEKARSYFFPLPWHPGNLCQFEYVFTFL